jgi:hypothetical protein
METTTSNKLLPQNFLVGIILSVSYIVDSLYDLFIRCSGGKINFEHHKILFLFNSILIIGVLLFERKYLKNFSVGNTIRWLDCCIVLPLLLCFLVILFHYVSVNKVLIAFTPLIILIAYWFCWVMFGISIRSVKNDFIGFLKQLGVSNIIATLFIPLSLVSVFTHNNIFLILAYAVNIPPLVILIIIYSHAIAFAKTMDNIKPELG